MSAAYAPDRLRSRLRDVRLGRVFRVIHRDHRSNPLRAAPAPRRFSDSKGGYSVLYAWNTAVSAAFYGPLQGLEVALRNAMHRRLAERLGAAGCRRSGLYRAHLLFPDVLRESSRIPHCPLPAND